MIYMYEYDVWSIRFDGSMDSEMMHWLIVRYMDGLMDWLMDWLITPCIKQPIYDPITVYNWITNINDSDTDKFDREP